MYTSNKNKTRRHCINACPKKASTLCEQEWRQLHNSQIETVPLLLTYLLTQLLTYSSTHSILVVYGQEYSFEFFSGGDNLREKYHGYRGAKT